jgi:glycosyltransferase involved in cell wall biosynthesis
MTNSKKVSFILAVYNDQENISRSIESMQAQTYKNIEIVILDDCSTDKTYDICKKLSLKDSRIKLYKNDINLGLTRSLNKLINFSSGEFIARQDSDDTSVDFRIETQIKFLEEYKLDLSYSRAFIKESNKVIPNFSYYLPLKLIVKYKNPFIHGTLFIKKDVITALGGYDEFFYFSQDYKLIKDVLKKGYKVKIDRKVLYNLNMKNNISTKYKDIQKIYANMTNEKI